MAEPIYLDNHATTPVDPRVIDAIAMAMRERFGNPASASHRYGKAASAAVEAARGDVAGLIGASPAEIVFTSGATESNNLAIKGAARACAARGRRHLITSHAEHKSVLDAMRALCSEGCELTVLEPGVDGIVRLAQVEAALRADTALVSLMFANNEVGTINPIAAVGRVLRARGVLFHCDAVQAAGRVPLDVAELGVDLLSLSAHKVYGPMGVGALYVRAQPRVDVRPLCDGGGQERGMRPGTLNVPGIVGFGVAARIAREEHSADAARALSQRERLRQRLSEALPHTHVHGSVAPHERLAGNLSIAFDHVEARRLLAHVEEHIAASAGSACTAASLEPSHVLRAMRVPHDRAIATIRIGIGRFTTDREIDDAATILIAAVRELRATSQVWRALYPDEVAEV